MILTKQVEIKWARTTKKWYETRGYVFTYIGDTFIVDVSDLKGKTKVKIDVKCDICGKILKDRDYNNILRLRENKNKIEDCCKSCSRRENTDIVRELFYKNNYVPLFSDNDYVNAHSKLQYICKTHPNKIRSITYTDLCSGTGCKDCAIESLADLHRKDFNEIIKYFNNKDMTLISDNKDYLTRDSTLKYICNKHSEIGVQFTTFNNLRNCNAICKSCIKENSSGENHPAWNGGITNINKYLREYIKQWKKDSIVNCNYKCIITGKRFNVVHHLYSFNKIVEETFNILNIKIKPSIIDFTIQELESLESKLLDLHYKYGFGVCLTNKVHDLFHSIYGKGNNTPEQWYEFENKIKIGKIKIV